MLFLLTALALAETPSPAAAAAPVSASDMAAPDAAPAPVERTFAERVEEAITVRRGGDVEAARALLVALEPLVPAAELTNYLYQRGICEELAYRPESALAFYDRAIELAGPNALDARFRRVLVLEELGMYAPALEEVRAIDRARGLSADDAITVSLQRGIAELASGKRRVGIKRIQAALDLTEGGDTHRYLRAKARFHLARALLDEADALPLTGGEKRIVRNLEGRATRIKAAEQQIIALAALREPEWVLQSLVSFGDSYVRLADALAKAPAPKRLTDPQEEIYRAELVKKAGNVRTKAYHAFDQGVAVATRLAWESPVVTVLQERRAVLQAER